MATGRPRTLVEILSTTLQELEQSEELRGEDPAINELKRSLVRAVAEILILRSGSTVKPSGASVLLPATQDSSVQIPESQEAPVPLYGQLPAQES